MKNGKDVRNRNNIQGDLKSLFHELRDEKKKKWDRVLPFEELLFDRWENAKYLKAKKGSSVYHNSYVYGNVIIGKNTWIGPYTLLDGSGGQIKIGDYCTISSGVHIYTHNAVKWILTSGKTDYDKKSVKIGNNTYIGPYAVLSMKASLGKYCVVGAHSFVNSPIPDNSIVAGVPGKIIGKVKITKNDAELVYFKNDTITKNSQDPKD